jgi:syndecan 1
VLCIQELELEEFRALEQEILGGNLSNQHHEQHPKQQQQPQRRQWQQQAPQSPLAAPAASGQPGLTAAEAAEAAAAAAAAAAAGDDELDLAAASSSRMVHFQDDTEWVDTEFSFGNAQQDQQQHQHVERHEQQEHQQQHAYTQQQKQHELDGAELDGTMSQPFVRSLFSKAAAAATAGSGSGRAGSAGRSKQQQAPAAAAPPAAAALGDVVGVVDGVQLLAVPADQVAKWQQLEASMPDMQRDKERLRKMRVELERAATRLEQERSTWEKQKVGVVRRCWIGC